LKEGLPSNAIISRELMDRLAHQEFSNKAELEQAMRYFPYRYERYGDAIFQVLERTME
jgi:hypothetical protein